MFEIAKSARKHGLSDEDILHAVEHWIEKVRINEYPDKLIYVGYDTKLRDLEAITIEFIDGVETIIHAMKVRNSTLQYIEDLKHERI
jgi:hypothetical protein